MNKMNMEKERWEVQGSLDIQDKKLKLRSDKSHFECVVSLIFCIRAPKVKIERRDIPLILTVILEKIRVGVLTLEQEVAHWNSVCEVAVTMFKEEQFTADKIP